MPAITTEQVSSPASTFGLLGLLAGISAVVAVHVWFNILRVPLVRPVGALFGKAPASQEGWAAWYLPPLAAAMLTLLILCLYFRRPHRWTVLGLAIAGTLAVLFGSWAALWVKNIGYTWYFVPGASTMSILSVQVQMAPFALARALNLMSTQMLLLLIGFVAGGLVGLLARFPLHASGSPPADRPADAPAAAVAAEPASAQTSPQAGRFARLATTVLMALMGGAVGAGLPIVGPIVMPIVALVWYYVSFRDGRYAFRNVAIGGAGIAFLSSMPLTLAMIPMGAGAETLLLSMSTRLPFFVLVSVGVIKLALYCSKKPGPAVNSAATAAIPPAR